MSSIVQTKTPQQQTSRNDLAQSSRQQTLPPELALQPQTNSRILNAQLPPLPPMSALEVDRENNGKFDVDVAAKHFAKGFFSPLTALFSSWKSALVGASIIAAGLVLTTAVPAAAPVLVAIGIGFGLYRAGTAMWKFAHAKNGDDVENAFYDTGQATLSLGLSFLTARPALSRAGIATEGMGRGEAVIEAVKAAPAMVAKSAATIRSGQAAKNLHAAANGLASYFGTDHTAPTAGVTSDNQLNLKQMLSINELDGRGLDRPVQIALTGYSAPPPGYEQATTKFTLQVIDKIGNRRVSIVTSPTATPGSIDGIGTAIADQSGLPITYLTANEYVKYIDPAVLPPTIDPAKYLALPKYVLPDAATYSKATAAMSTSLLVEGGRNTAVSDFVNSVTYGNKVVVVQLPGAEAWDVAKGTVGNASTYLSDQLSAYFNGNPLPHPEVSGMTKLFLAEHADRIRGLVRIVKATDSGAVAAAEHLAPANYGGAQGAAAFGAVQEGTDSKKASSRR